MRPSSALLTLAASVIALAGGCGPTPSATPTAGAPAAGAIPTDPETARVLQNELTDAINEAELRYKPLHYEYAEGLLKIVDAAEAHLSGKAKGSFPRAMPKLDEAEEIDHFREVIRRWEAKTGQSFRPAIEPLLAEVAARQPGGPAFHPDFHKRFALVFDAFVPIEVQEIRERQNRLIHAKAEELFAKHRATQPDTVRYFEQMIARQYPSPPAPKPAP